MIMVKDAWTRLDNCRPVLPILALLLGFLLFGCSHTDSEKPNLSYGSGQPVRIVVLPFQQILPENIQKGAVESPLTGAIFDAAKPPGSPEAVLEREFLGVLGRRSDLAVIDGESASPVFRAASSSSMRISLRDALCATGKQLDASFVVVGYLYRFRELQGESFSAERPASVAFEMVMLNVADKKVVWRGIFDHTQKSLMENLLQSAFFWRGSGKWMRAEELAKQGLEEVMKTFPLFFGR
jgi:hypothetical protein